MKARFEINQASQESKLRRKIDENEKVSSFNKKSVAAAYIGSNMGNTVSLY